MTINDLDYNKIYELVGVIRPDYDESDINSLIANAKTYKTIYTLFGNNDGYIILDKDYLVFEAKFHDVDYVKKIVEDGEVEEDDQTVLDGLLVWCSGVKSAKTTSKWEDISGNNKHITLSDVSFENNAFNFNGYPSIGNIPVNMDIFNNGATISAYVRYDQFANYQGVVGDLTESGNPGVIFGGYANGNWEFGFHLGGFIALSIDSIKQSRFCELVMTYDKSYLKVYVNGVLQGVQAKTDPGVVSQNLVLGRSGISSVRYLVGAVGDVKVYNRALSDKEVLQNYNQLMQTVSK